MGTERRGYNRSKDYAHIVDLPVVHGRPMPGKLGRVERKIWNQMVAAMPHGYFGPQNEHLLKMLCSSVATAEIVGRQLAVARDAGDLEKVDALSKIHESSSRVIGDLSSRLKLTPRSKMSPEQASHRQRLGAQTRPWEGK